MNVPNEYGATPMTAVELVELQDQLLEAATDLERLSGLLDGAAEQLMQRFSAADASLRATTCDDEAVHAARGEIDGAVTALQFPDMASQILTHTVRRIRGVGDFLGARVSTDDEAEVAPPHLVQRHCPVAQREVEAGSIELF